MLATVSFAMAPYVLLFIGNTKKIKHYCENSAFCCGIQPQFLLGNNKKIQIFLYTGKLRM